MHPVAKMSSHNFVSQHTFCARFSFFLIQSGRPGFDSCQGMGFLSSSLRSDKAHNQPSLLPKYVPGNLKQLIYFAVCLPTGPQPLPK
jgi:hypothetical protein